MSSSSGYTIRLLYSPMSRSLCIHFFDIDRPFSDPKLNEELKNYKYAYTHHDNSDTKMNIDCLELPSSNVYLKRNKRKRGDLKDGDVYISQNISAHFSINCLKLRNSSNQTDVVVRNKRFKVSEKDEINNETEPKQKLEVHNVADKSLSS